MLWAHDRIGEWADAGLLKPLTISDDFKAGFIPMSWDAVTHNKQIWGYPLALEAVSLIYNKKYVTGNPPAQLSEISVFAKAPGTLLPNDLVQHGSNIFAVAQDNNNNPDGTVVAGTSPQSEVIEYDLSGNVVKTFNVPGHPDGIVEFDSHTIWVSTNEDANPLLIVIDTAVDVVAEVS